MHVCVHTCLWMCVYIYTKETEGERRESIENASIEKVMTEDY